MDWKYERKYLKTPIVMFNFDIFLGARNWIFVPISRKHAALHFLSFGRQSRSGYYIKSIMLDSNSWKSTSIFYENG